MFSIFVFLLKKFGLMEINMDTALMPYFLSAFFISIGFCINTSSIKSGGRLLFIYWILCAVLGLCQNMIAVTLSKILNINPLLGFMCGSVSMEGGHGYALAFGKAIEGIGVENASTIGIAAATLGLIAGSLLGSPVGRYLIHRHNLKPSFKDNFQTKPINKNSTSSHNKNIFTPISFFENILILLLIMNISHFLSNAIYLKTDILIPNIVIGMFLSVITTNLNYKIGFFDFNFDFFEFIQSISLGIFLTMALMTVDIYTLSSMLGSILFIVICQVVFVLFYGVFVCFVFLEKNYDAAIIVSGLIGHTLGATPNALANMSALTDKYGKSENAFLVVTMVAAFLLDAFSVPCILFFINFLK
ncbi:MAG: sodium/glutamate symporter [Intestinibacter sp.]